MKRGGRIAAVSAGVVAAALGVMQLMPVQRPKTSSTQSERADIAAPPQIEATLQRACYDCHSDETHWPWYSAIAPVSWLVAHDVDYGRREMDFSQWQNYYPATRIRKLEWMGRALHEEVMPPWPYQLMHPRARLSNEERAALEQWVEAEVDHPQGAAGTAPGH
jgi:mono/diheme cytochrome c family protein